MIKREMMKVISSNKIALDTVEMILGNEYISANAKPGQFLHISVPNFTLRRPISIASVDKIEQTVTILFKIIGNGTKNLAQIPTGTNIDVLGPNGSSFPMDVSISSALLVGGGVGIPPLYFLATQLKKAGIQVNAILGFQTDEAVFYEEKFKKLGNTYVVTNDGSHGYKGLVTDIIPEITGYDTYFSCGPLPMLRAVKQMITNVEGYLSFEERMGCGVGTCLACVIPTNNERGYAKICQDGPVIRANEVNI